MVHWEIKQFDRFETVTIFVWEQVQGNSLKIVKAIVLVLVQYKAIVLVLVQYGNPLLILEFLSMGIVAVWIYKVEWIVMEISDNVKE